MKNELRDKKIGLLAVSFLAWLALAVGTILGSDTCGFIWLYITVAYMTITTPIVIWSLLKWLFRLATKPRTLSIPRPIESPTAPVLQLSELDKQKNADIDRRLSELREAEKTHRATRL